jgi:hypothetical protein
MAINPDSIEQYYRNIVPHSPKRIAKAMQLAHDVNKTDKWVADSVLELLNEQGEELNDIDPLHACYESIFWGFWDEICLLTEIDIQDLDGKFLSFDDIKTPFGCDKIFKKSIKDIVKEHNITSNMLSFQSNYFLKAIGIE